MNNRRIDTDKPFNDVGWLLLFIVLLPLIITWLVLHILAGLVLRLAAWSCWCARGRYILFVYSDSPVWREYVEEHILPRLGGRAVVLNWSERGKWKRTLAVFVFRHFGGSRDFNPMAVVFRPFRRVRTFRFLEPFRDFKHGKAEAVEKMSAELFGLVDEINGAQAS